MTDDTRAALVAFVEAVAEATRAAERASARLGRECLADNARLIDPELVAGLACATEAAVYIEQRAKLMSLALVIAGSTNGRGWLRALEDAIMEKRARAMTECSCGACTLCAAAADARRQVEAIVEAAGKAR